MKPAVEWLNDIGETVMFAAFVGGNPPGNEVEKLVERIQRDALASLRDREEIQRAHNFLIAMLNDERTFASPEVERSIHASADVLCWVLKHDHNDTFANNLAGLERTAAGLGIKLVAYKSHAE